VPDHIDQTAAALAEDWPLWEIWVVPRVQGGPVWCARRRDDHRTVLNAGDPGTLAEYLEDVSAP
jgi:hypothetical protein